MTPADSADDARLRRALLACGIVALAAYTAHAGLSWLLAPFATYEDRPFAQYEFFARIAEQIPFLQGRARDGLPEFLYGIQLSLRARGLFESRTMFMAGYAAPHLLATLAALGAGWALWRRRATMTPAVADTLFRWGIAFAVVSMLAVPVLVPDFWLSVAWGRTLAAGINPYYEVPGAATDWLPLDAPIMRMTYGPLWAYLSATVMKVTGGHALWGAFGFKLVLAGLWIALLAVVRRLVRDRSPFEQALAMVLVGWLPIGVVQTVAEGHNDVAMVLGVMAWLLWRIEGRGTWATAALTASVLCKYASAPLFLLDFLYRDIHESRSPVRYVRAYITRGLVALGLTILVFFPLFRGPDFFASTSDVHSGFFFLPSDAVFAIQSLTGFPLTWLAYAVLAVFPVISALALLRYVREGGTKRLRETTAAVMLSVLFVAASHVWPWYVLWLLAPAATIPLSTVGRWATGVALAMPFPLLVWTAFSYASDYKKFQLPSLAAYGAALVWLLVMTRMGAERLHGPPDHVR